MSVHPMMRSMILGAPQRTRLSMAERALLRVCADQKLHLSNVTMYLVKSVVLLLQWLVDWHW